MEAAGHLQPDGQGRQPSEGSQQHVQALRRDQRADKSQSERPRLTGHGWRRTQRQQVHAMRNDLEAQARKSLAIALGDMPRRRHARPSIGQQRSRLLMAGPQGRLGPGRQPALASTGQPAVGTVAGLPSHVDQVDAQAGGEEVGQRDDHRQTDALRRGDGAGHPHGVHQVHDVEGLGPHPRRQLIAHRDID
jgi:hypothetical protein